jgi:hypothetical protein
MSRRDWRRASAQAKLAKFRDSPVNFDPTQPPQRTEAFHTPRFPTDAELAYDYGFAGDWNAVVESDRKPALRALAELGVSRSEIRGWAHLSTSARDSHAYVAARELRLAYSTAASIIRSLDNPMQRDRLLPILADAYRTLAGEIHAGSEAP